MRPLRGSHCRIRSSVASFVTASGAAAAAAAALHLLRHLVLYLILSGLIPLGYMRPSRRRCAGAAPSPSPSPSPSPRLLRRHLRLRLQPQALEQADAVALRRREAAPVQFLDEPAVAERRCVLKLRPNYVVGVGLFPRDARFGIGDSPFVQPLLNEVHLAAVGFGCVLSRPLTASIHRAAT